MTKFLTGALALTAAALLAGCELEDPAATTTPVASLPPEVIAALPPGVPSDIVFLAASGCYAYAIEVTEPRSGYAVRDRNGNPICDPTTKAAADAKAAEAEATATPTTGQGA